jgi:outer membrane receptor protein involved in Fe transport
MIAVIRKRISSLVVGIAIVASLPLYAQSGSATLQGTVTDPSGAVVPNAKIHIEAPATGVTRDVITNSAGFYSAPNLNADTYNLTVVTPGFAKKTQKDIELTVGAIKDLDVALTVSATDVTITVESASNAVNLVDTSVQGVIDGKTTRDLPLNGRDWTTLSTLNSGVSQILTQYAGAATATTRLSRGLGSQLTIGGNRPQQNSYRLDGVNVNDYANGGPGSVLSSTLGVDAVQEFNVITSDAPAQYGRMSGGVINSITRQGGNQFHGSAYDYLRNNVFDARGYFDPLSGEPSFRRNQFGGTIGGPIVKDKTFFFFNYEGFRQAQGVSTTSTVLSPNAKTGLVTCTGTGKAPCYTAPGSTTPAPTGTTGVQQLTINAKVAPFLALFPTPNGTISGNTGSNNFTSATVGNEDFFTVHMDHNFSQKDSLHGTLLYDTASLAGADTTDTLYDEAISRRTTASLEEIHIFTSRLANSFRLGYNRAVAIAPDVKSVLNPAVLNPALSYYSGLSVGQLAISGGPTTVQGGPGAVGTNAFHYNSYQIYDDATYVLGRHSITFGGNVELDQNNVLGGVLPNGQWSFTSINNFLTNVPNQFTGGVPGTPVVPHDLRQTLYAAYVQDSWKLASNLTVNLGLRYEMVTDTSETAGRLGALPTQTSPASVYVNHFFTNNPTAKNFEPRLGLAWDPYHNGKTVITAASGIYDNLPLNYFLQLQIISSAPSYEEGVTSVSPAAGSFPTTPFYTTTPLLRSIYTPQAPPRSYVIQSNLNVQQQLASNLILQVGYITSHGVHQVFTSNDINTLAPLGKSPSGSYYWPSLTTLPATSAARAALVLNPAVGVISDTIFAGSSLYNSLQASLSYSAPKGITGKISYTWSHSIDDSSSAISGSSYSNGDSTLPAFDLRLDRADSDFDLRNVFSLSAVAPLHDIQRGGVYTSILRHWTWNNIVSARTGIPFTPTDSVGQLGALGTAVYEVPDRVVYGRSCINKHSTTYIDTSCFAFPQNYTYAPGLSGPLLGTSRRNTLDGPGLFVVTTGLMKDQPITERVRAQFQVQAFNVLNHTEFANPASSVLFSSTGVLSPTAGVITSTAYPGAGRELQFALKILF